MHPCFRIDEFSRYQQSFMTLCLVWWVAGEWRRGVQALHGKAAMPEEVVVLCNHTARVRHNV